MEEIEPKTPPAAPVACRIVVDLMPDLSVRTSIHGSMPPRPLFNLMIETAKQDLLRQVLIAEATKRPGIVLPPAELDGNALRGR